MTTGEREQWDQDTERIINIRAMMDMPCGQSERLAHEKWVGWWLQKAVELGLSRQLEVFGGERREVLERIQHFMPPTPPEKRCLCGKGMVLLNAMQQIWSCDVKPALIRKESELRKIEGERVLKRERQDVDERFEQAKVAAQGCETSWSEAHAPNLSTG